MQDVFQQLQVVCAVAVFDMLLHTPATSFAVQHKLSIVNFVVTTVLAVKLSHTVARYAFLPYAVYVFITSQCGSG